MNYNFELRKDKKNKSGLMPIRLVVTANNKRIRVGIPVKVREKDWNESNELIDNPNTPTNKLYREYSKGNQILIETRGKLDEIFSFFQYNNIPFTKEKFLTKFTGKESQISLSFFEAYEEYIRVSKTKRAKGTITKYKSVGNFLKDFEGHTGFKLRLDNIDFRFEDEFRDYCFNVKFTLNNYYAKIVKTLKAFMNWAHKRGYHQSLKFKDIKSKEDDIEVIYLTKEELQELYYYPFENKSLDRARDFFCFLCLTGQRHSDIYNITEASLKTDMLNFTTVKNKKVDHTVYLTEKARKLVEKYRDTIYFPIPRIHSNKLNKRIQKCCEMLGFTEEIVLTRFSGSKRIDETFRKCDVITSHVGRKTFVTNGIMFDIPIPYLQLMTGHSDYKSFEKYAGKDIRKLKKEMQKWDF